MDVLSIGASIPIDLDGQTNTVSLVSTARLAQNDLHCTWLGEIKDGNVKRKG
jgi:hypothetical protein